MIVFAFLPVFLYVAGTLVVHGREGPGVLAGQLGGLMLVLFGAGLLGYLLGF